MSMSGKPDIDVKCRPALSIRARVCNSEPALPKPPETTAARQRSLP